MRISALPQIAALTQALLAMLYAVIFASAALAQPTESVAFGLRFAVVDDQARQTLAQQRVPVRRTSDQLEDVDRDDAIRVHLFAADSELAQTVADLQTQGSLESLGIVSMIAPLGREAVWTLGGELPIPDQPAMESEPAGLLADDATPAFALPAEVAEADRRVVKRDFGLRLSLVGVRLDEGTLRVRVRPTVRSVDFGNATTRGSRVQPSIETRRGDYFLDVREGQSFLIAGVIDRAILRRLARVPGVPATGILGQIRSLLERGGGRSLALLVTPRIIASQ